MTVTVTEPGHNADLQCLVFTIFTTNVFVLWPVNCVANASCGWHIGE